MYALCLRDAQSNQRHAYFAESAARGASPRCALRIPYSHLSRKTVYSLQMSLAQAVLGSMWRPVLTQRPQRMANTEGGQHGTESSQMGLVWRLLDRSTRVSK